jgi:hypothetical protein
MFSRISSWGDALKKIAQSGGRHEIFGDISCEKSRFYAKKSYFSNFRGGARRVRPPPWIRPCIDIGCLNMLHLIYGRNIY